MNTKKYEQALLPKKTRLLLYIRDKDLIELFSGYIFDTKIKLTDLQRELGYNSPSHLYQDLMDLSQRGYIEYHPTQDNVKITDKGKKLTERYAYIRSLCLILIIFSLGLLPILLYIPKWVWVYSALLSGISLSCGVLIIVNLWKLIKEKIVF
ncbi:MAG: hypothetical protein QXL91_03810 [Candidatus Bathyarchaeia archaeon]